MRYHLYQKLKRTRHHIGLMSNHTINSCPLIRRLRSSISMSYWIGLIIRKLDSKKIGFFLKEHLTRILIFSKYYILLERPRDFILWCSRVNLESIYIYFFWKQSSFFNPKSIFHKYVTNYVIDHYLDSVKGIIFLFYVKYEVCIRFHFSCFFTLNYSQSFASFYNQRSL